MPSIFLILIKINAVLLLFAIAYILVLRRLTFYTINRYFLLIGILFSSVYPFIDLTQLFAKQSKISLDLVPVIYTNDALNNGANPFYWNVISVVFYIGMALLFLRFLIQLFSLFRVHQNSYPSHINHYPIRVLKEKINPFSFWNSIYINPEIHSQSDLQTILAHEKIHVRQKHTVDIILSELSVIIYWFNPGVWLIKKAVKENIEFIADAEVLKQRIDKKAYQYDLLKVETGHTALALVNAFSISGLKKRIQMMNVKRSSPYKMIVYFILLPVVIVFALAFTISKKDILADRVLKNTITQSVSLVRLPPDTYDIPLDNSSDSNFKVDEAILTRVEVEKPSQAANPTKSGYLEPILVSTKLTEDGGFDSKNVKVVSVRKFSTRLLSNDTLPNKKRGFGEIKESDAVKISVKEVVGQNKITFNQNGSKPVISMSTDYIRNMGPVKKRRYYLNGKEITESELKDRLKPYDIKGITVNKADSINGVYIISK